MTDSNASQPKIFPISPPAFTSPVASADTASIPGAPVPWLERISIRRFRLLVLLLFAWGLFLASQGMQRMASLRANYYLGQIRARAVSPLGYGAELPALHALTARASSEVRIIVRADSAGESADRLCALATELASDPRVVWTVRSEDFGPCGASASLAPLRASVEAGGELARARWVILGSGGRVLHSAWDVPDARTLRETAALFDHRQPETREP